MRFWNIICVTVWPSLIAAIFYYFIHPNTIAKDINWRNTAFYGYNINININRTQIYHHSMKYFKLNYNTICVDMDDKEYCLVKSGFAQTLITESTFILYWGHGKIWFFLNFSFFLNNFNQTIINHQILNLETLALVP